MPTKPQAYGTQKYLTIHWLCHLEHSPVTEHLVNQGHWIQSDNMVARYLNKPMESFTKPSTSIHGSSTRNKGATDTPGLDHHPHNSATNRILHNPQHGYSSCNNFWI